MRGTTGFGAKQHLRTDRLLTLSEDLPLVAVGVDAPRAGRGGAARRRRRWPSTASSRSSARGAASADLTPAPPKLTVYMGRARAATTRWSAALHRHGVAGATVLLGVDGTAHGERRRARFLGRNAGVPLMVVSVGEAAALAAALPEIAGCSSGRSSPGSACACASATAWRSTTPEPAEGDAWQKLMVYAQPPGSICELVRWLRAAGAAGATDAARRLGLPRRPHAARRERLAAAAAARRW